MLVSVVIATDNRLAHLENLVSALRYQEYKDFEVIIVVGPTQDGTREFVFSLGSEATIAYCDERNISKARNAGIRMASGEVVAFIDDDAIPEPSWIAKIVSAFTNPRLGCFGGALRDHTGFSYQALISACDRFGHSYVYETVQEAYKKGVVQSAPKAQKFLSPTGANSAFRRSALLEVGGFDEFFAYFLDETDVTLRILERGWLVDYDLSCEVIHQYAPSSTRKSKKVPLSILFEVRSNVYFKIIHTRNFFSKNYAERDIETYLSHFSNRIENMLNSGDITWDHAQKLRDELRLGEEQGRRQANVEPQVLTIQKIDSVGKNFSALIENDFREEVLPKVIVVCRHYLNDKRGGIAVWIKSVAEELSKRGVLVTIICESRSGRHEADFVEGHYVHAIPLSKFADGDRREIPNDIWHWSISALEEALRVRYVRGGDCVLAPIWDAEGIAFVRSKVIPVVTSMHTTYSLSLDWKKEWLENKKYKEGHVDKVIDAEFELFNNSDFILANSHAIINDFLGASEMGAKPRQYELVHHGIRSHSVASKDQTGPLRLLFVGRLEKRKGIDTAIRVFECLLAKGLDLYIDVVGYADLNDSVAFQATKDLARLKELYGDRIGIHGYVADDQLSELYEAAHVFLAPSRYESFGLIYIEAMSYGCVPIGCRVGGVPEVLDEADSFVVDVDDHKAIETAIESVWKDRSLLMRMSDHAINRCDRLFSHDKMGDELFNFVLKSTTPKANGLVNGKANAVSTLKAV